MDIVRHLIAGENEKPDVVLALAPPGVTPNFVDPPSRGPQMVGVSISITALTSITIMARIYTKSFMTKGFEAGDYLAILALLCAIARSGCNCVDCYTFGLGRHVWDVRPENFAMIRNLQFIMDMVYLWGIMFAKLSILCFYVKVFHIRRRFRWFCYFMMFITFAYCFTFFFIYAFDCKPVYWNWHFDPLDYDCIDITHVKMAVGAVNIATDLVIMVMPLPLVIQLLLAKPQKIGLILVFSTGIFILITTIVREVFVVRNSRKFDAPWSVADEVIWLTVELNIGIICITMPILTPIRRKALQSQLGFSYLRSLFSSMRQSRGSSKLSDFKPKSGVSDDWSTDVKAQTPGSSHFDRINHGDTGSAGLISFSSGFRRGALFGELRLVVFDQIACLYFWFSLR